MQHELQVIVLVPPHTNSASIPPNSDKPEQWARFARSCQVNQLPIVEAAGPFGAIDFRNQLAELAAKNPALLVLWIDDPADSIVAASQGEIIHKYFARDHRVAFGASKRCTVHCELETWPASTPTPSTLQLRAPRAEFADDMQKEVPPPELWRYLDVGVFLADISSLIQMMAHMLVPHANGGASEEATAWAKADNDLTSTSTSTSIHAVYLDQPDRERLGVGVDHGQNLFQTLVGLQAFEMEAADLSVEFTFRGENDTRIYSARTHDFPCVLVGRGNTNLLNQIGNYVPLQWTPDGGCAGCKERRRCLPSQGQDATQPPPPSVPPGSATTPGLSQLNDLDVLDGHAQEDEQAAAPTDEHFPTVHVGMVIEGTSPFLSAFLKRFEEQAYPKSRQSLAVYIVASASSEHRYTPLVMEWIERVDRQYRTVSIFTTSFDEMTEMQHARATLAAAEKEDADFYFRITSHSMLDSTSALRELIESNRAVVGPLLRRPNLLFSNFWASAEADAYADIICTDADRRCDSWKADGYCLKEHKHGEWMMSNCPRACGACLATAASAKQIRYNRGFDYEALAVDGTATHRQGVWAVPMLIKCVLLEQRAYKSLLKAIDGPTGMPPDATEPTWAVDMQLVEWLKQADELLHMNNNHQFGWLVMPDTYDHTKLHPELYMLESNPIDWEQLYIDPTHRAEAHRAMTFVRPECWDIYNFPLFTGGFCDDLIEESEHYGKWSGSSTYDDRLKGGIEPVPTQDIHFNQMGFNSTWKAILNRFVGPVAQHQFTGYTYKGKETLDFIVRYSSEGQAALRPHFDASTFSLNVALNHIGIDFQGGGTHFTRQNCTMQSNKKGSALMHPGVLTHQHEGLPTTNGTRYIIVSFIDQR